MLLRDTFGRDLISDRMVRITHLPQCVREAVLASLNDPRGVRERAERRWPVGRTRTSPRRCWPACATPTRTYAEGAAAALGGRGGQDITAALLARLGDPDPGVCVRVVNVLAGREGQHVASALLARLGDPDPRVRRRVVQALAGGKARTSPRRCWPASATPTRTCAGRPCRRWPGGRASTSSPRCWPASATPTRVCASGP